MNLYTPVNFHRLSTLEGGVFVYLLPNPDRRI